MIKHLNHLYNTRHDTGDLVIKCCDSTIKCHKFVLIHTSNNVSDYIVNEVLELPYQNKKIITLLLKYLYTESLRNILLDGMEIMDLLKLIALLQLNSLVQPLHELLLKLLKSKITKENWLYLLKSVTNNKLFEEIEIFLWHYFDNNILTSKSIVEYLIQNDIINRTTDKTVKIILNKSLNKICRLLDNIIEMKHKTVLNDRVKKIIDASKPINFKPQDVVIEINMPKEDIIKKKKKKKRRKILGF